MSTWSVKRRFNLIFSLGLVVIAVAGIYYFFSRPAPTCFDGIKNQDEKGIDCGGSCRRICSADVKPLRVLWVRPFAVTPNMHSVAALVENPNNTAGVSSLDYQLRLVNTAGETLAIKSGRSEARADGQFIIFESNIITTEPAARAFLDLAEDQFWEELPARRYHLPVTQRSFQAEPAPRLTASISNRETIDFTDLPVVVVLADADGNAFAASRTVIEYLPRFSDRDLYFTWPAPFNRYPAFVDFYVQPTVTE
ncbi:MAG: hypothetical protein WDZ85_02625 [Candidatus Paceibacterota bacterium]